MFCSARRSLKTLVRGVALSVAIVGAFGATSLSAHASAPFGSVLLSGAQWAGADAGLGDLNVYSNGSQNQDTLGPFGLQYECTELVQRFAHFKYGEPALWPVRTAAEMWNAGPYMPVPLLQHPNGGDSAPQYGDILVFGASGGNTSGHVAVVSSVSAGSVTAVHQNFSFNGNLVGQWTQAMSGTSVSSVGGLPLFGWLRPFNAPVAGTVASVGPAVIATGNGDQTVFWKGTTRTLFASSSTNGQWSQPVAVSGGAGALMASQPSAVITPSGLQVVVWQGTDDNLWEANWSRSRGWSGPFNLGMGPLGSQPTVAAWGSEIDVFWKGQDSNLWEAWNPGNAWYGPQNLGMGPLGSQPTAGDHSNGEQDVFWRGSDSQLWEGFFDGRAWRGPQTIGMGPLGSAPSVAVRPSGDQEVAWKGTDGGIWMATYSNGWFGPNGIGMGPLGSPPTLAASSTGITAFWEGTDYNLWHADRLSSSPWLGPNGIGLGPLG